VGGLGAAAVGPTSQVWFGAPIGAEGGATGGPANADGSYLRVGGPPAWAGSLPSCFSGPSVRVRAARTLRSRFDRRDEYIERVCTDLCRMTKKTDTMPITATNGPTKNSGDIGGPDYGRLRSYVTIAAVALYDRLQTELVDARRRRDALALDTLSLLKSEVVKASKDAAAGGKLDDDLLVRVARKEVKRREEAIDVYRKAGREETARREEAEMALLRTYLPAAMSVDQVEAEVRKIIDELKPEGSNAFGVVMKAATARLAGKAEGAQIAAAARKLLAA
jgi:uncharacterized protein